MRALRSVAAVLALAAIIVTGCQDTQTIRAVDGDTIETGLGTIRVIGIDTPEVGEPCYAEAKARTAQLTEWGQAELVYSEKGDERDKYGRLLRHVIVRGSGDLGEILIREGLANARYDGYDGYGNHDLQGRYRLFDLATPHRCGAAMDAVGGDLPSNAPPTTPPGGGVTYANCAEVRAAGKAPLHAGQPGYSRDLDGDGDGVACE